MAQPISVPFVTLHGIFTILFYAHEWTLTPFVDTLCVNWDIMKHKLLVVGLG
jgi:hypothetical protein